MTTNMQILQTGRGDSRHILFIGANVRTAHFVDTLFLRGTPDCSIEGFLDDDPNGVDVLQDHGVPCLGRLGDLGRVLTERVVDCVYVCLSLRSSYDEVQAVVDLCEKGGVPVRMPVDLLEPHFESGTPWLIEDMMLMSAEARPLENTKSAGRRVGGGTYARLTALLLPLAMVAAAFFGRGFGIPEA